MQEKGAREEMGLNTGIIPEIYDRQTAVVVVKGCPKDWAVLAGIRCCVPDRHASRVGGRPQQLKRVWKCTAQRTRLCFDFPQHLRHPIRGEAGVWVRVQQTPAERLE
eukprot:EG_transcript_14707